MDRARKFTTLCAGTSFDFCYNDYYVIENKPGFWRKTIPGRVIPEWAALAQAEDEDEDEEKEFLFFLDEQAYEEFSDYIKWAARDMQEDVDVDVREDEDGVLSLTTFTEANYIDMIFTAT